MSYSPDGRSIAVYDEAGNWGVMSSASLMSTTTEWLLPPRKFTGPAPNDGMASSADGSVVATVGSGAVDLWDAKTLGHLGTLRVGPANQVPNVTLEPDGHTLLIAHPAGHVMEWNLRPQHLLDLACDRAGRNLTAAEWHRVGGGRAYHQTCVS